ncbi:DNA/RNA nuclease SfsA [Pseudoteredinibacter isoporae]|uniref:Sugar fermentation stimulation protein homolog n=1 Tax=Pseudoteredinibacter isoporae TaxID=570281 RepID=A0A7X0MWQ9_9GAMM|nr:DNA/RNA nuclease SfsA [Pseudoteredinibacter isoporae]MBB6522976.1 sugar fermentation stimulation protein A [Pseudoteredinibacter isoporae]NHO88500.1 DNA/RNA nuclease SfsA [Pseudoteredinibacter isoporae]NIB22101.1 DNA/RNA nuclease SfsA [Pseudoteredinibacter isoporae]
MLFSPPLIQGQLIRRYKRFLADVIGPSGEELTIHCPNTGSMKHCMMEGRRVWYSTSDNPKRKYPHTWEISENEQGDLIGVNSAAANGLLEEALNAGMVQELAAYGEFRREVKLPGGKRLDFLLEGNPDDPRPCYLEVKSMTLMREPGLAEFPDAVTKRGREHVLELKGLVEGGARAILFFCVQHSAAKCFDVAADIDPDYAAALEEALQAGVELIAYKAVFSDNEIKLSAESLPRSR